MKFTLIFPSDEGFDLSVGVVFIPCIAWKIGFKCRTWYPHRDNPNYLYGDFQNLLERMTKDLKYMHSPNLNEKIFIVVHNTGHGTEEDLSKLIVDIELTGYLPVICR